MKLGYLLELWNEYHVKQIININLRTHPSMLLTGSSGSGKSYSLKWLIDNLLENDVELYFCNFKNSDDFKFLSEYEKYYTFKQVGTGLQDFYNRFKKIQESETGFNGHFYILVFDEFPAFIQATTMQDKKLAESYKMMVSEILMLGRSYGIGIWLICQRPDSTFLPNGARDNFQTTITVGNQSKEARAMLYSGLELPDRVYKVGEGICWINGGNGITEIKYPKIKNMQALEKKILSRLTATNGKQA